MSARLPSTQDGRLAWFHRDPQKVRPSRRQALARAKKATTHADVGSESIKRTFQLFGDLQADLAIPLKGVAVIELVGSKTADLVDNFLSSLLKARNQIRGDAIRTLNHFEPGSKSEHRLQLRLSERVGRDDTKWVPLE